MVEKEIRFRLQLGAQSPRAVHTAPWRSGQSHIYTALLRSTWNCHKRSPKCRSRNVLALHSTVYTYLHQIHIRVIWSLYPCSLHIPQPATPPQRRRIQNRMYTSCLSPVRFSGFSFSCKQVFGLEKRKKSYSGTSSNEVKK
jgi:hypothetical protein